MNDDPKSLYYAHKLSVPETPMPGERPKPWGKTNIVGAAKPRVDAYERVSGTAVYPTDLVLPNTLYGAVLRCPHPSAEVKKLDTRGAEKMDGVRAIVSGAALRQNLKWTYSQWSPPREMETDLFDPRCRFEGEVVAAVAAETPYQAWDAIRAMDVEFAVGGFVVDETQALQSNVALVHEEGNRVQTQMYERGDVNEGFEEADVVLEETYSTACQIHTPMELHGCVASWDGDRLTVWESTQGVYAVQEEIARILGLPLSKIRVVGHYLGGGFGSKLQPGKYTIIAALLAKKAGRPAG